VSGVAAPGGETHGIGVDPLGVVVDSHPRSRVVNSQPAGIGRVVALSQGWAWNNLGRNVVFASASFDKVACFDQTLYPDDDEPSQYDLDIHAILELRSAGVTVALNHLGLLRAFRATGVNGSATVAALEPLWTSRFADDAERVIAVGDQLIGSRPRHQQVGGVLVSEPLTTRPEPDISTAVSLEDWEVVRALDAFSLAAGECVAVGADQRVALCRLDHGTVGQPVWDRRVDFQPAAFSWDGQLLWAAGSQSAAEVDDYDWEQLRGGRFVGLDPADGRTVVAGDLEDVAWGNGGTAVVLTRRLVCAVERTGSLALYSKDDGRRVGRTPSLASHPLGIAHAAATEDHILVGFNRAGYTLRCFAAASLERLARV
jgi:hypothetical protein